MSRMIRLMVLLVLAFALPVAAAPPDPVAIATRLLNQLDAGGFEAATGPFTPQMREAVSADALRQIWGSLPPAAGRGEAVVQKAEGATIVVIPLHRQGMELLAQVAIVDDGRIAGFMVEPAPPPPAPAPPADAPYVEREARVGEGERALPATLTMPRGDGPFPAVVLVHGSGPQDRDETIGANRPFLDIARGLAARGIATLRYDKRTQARPQDFAAGDVDVDSETTDDAVAALATLRATPGIDPARVFVLGHSQGGMLAPRIAKRSGHVAGVIMLAAPARPLLDLLPEQNRYLMGLDGRIDAQEQAFLDALDGRIAAIRSGREVPVQEAPLGLPAAYWRSTDAVRPVDELEAVQVPALLLQGGRDFQVVDADWQLWQAAFGANPRVTLRRYPALNHLGIAGSGPGSLEEYGRPGHVDDALIADVADWIGRH